jgi:hypothetical protein
MGLSDEDDDEDCGTVQNGDDDSSMEGTNGATQH